MNKPDVQVAIIGAGFAGIGTAIRLKKAGIESFTIFERGGEIGGTWRDNTYPGAACDVPSHVYSLSFEPNPDWTRRFSPSEEIQAYLLRLVEKWQLRWQMRLGTEIAEARFDEARGLWTLTTRGGETHEARVVVSCVGGLVDPAIPDIKGIQSFGGEMFHTARWNHDYDLTGRNVAVIGTGASAVQVVPQVAPQVAKLSVFQRTPAWVVPKQDARYSERARR
ncbi:MAG TPA: NAD(P)/FAD-dependent oxidoreductase, partial [Myxococcota bacterium]|nr:NAD(P)/FAD-dependent oxidoreductase [Myxococcota bacterium]